MQSPASALLRQAASIARPSESVLFRAILDDLRTGADLSADTRALVLRRICLPATNTPKTPLDWIAQAASTNAIRPHLHHMVETVREDNRELAATDGQRLHVMTCKDIPPSKDLPVLPNIRRVNTDGTPVDAASDGTNDYPNYARIIPETGIPIDLDISDLEWCADQDKYRLLVGVNEQWFDACNFLAAANNSTFTFEPGAYSTRSPVIVRPHSFPGTFAVLVPVRT